MFGSFRLGSTNASASASAIAYAPYWERAQWPLQSLIALTPLILFYEVGLRLFPPIQHLDIYARTLLFRFFHAFGVNGYYLPGLIVVVVLIAWHLTRRDPWRLELRLYAWMWIESLVLAVCLYIFAAVILRAPAIGGAAEPAGRLVDLGLQSVQGIEPDWPGRLILSLGAGIYEELLFRLIALALLHLLLVDLLALPDAAGSGIAVIVSSLLFAVYHFPSLGDISAMMFIYYTAAGIYLAGVYVLRGFGIVACTHALFDVLVVLL